MQKNSFNEFQFKEYESIMKLNANQDDKLEGVQVDSLEERIETVSNFLKYRELLSLIASNNTFKEFSLNNGTRVKVFSKNGYIFGKQLCQNGWLGLNLL